MTQMTLGANCWRDKFKWVREGEDYESRMAGNKRQKGLGQDDRALNPPEERLDFTQKIIGNFQRVLSRRVACWFCALGSKSYLRWNLI